MIWLSGTAHVICASTGLPGLAWYEPVAHHDPDEVRMLGGRLVAPEGASVRNPAFDVTPAALVDAIVTERGVSGPPHAEALARFLS